MRGFEIRYLDIVQLSQISLVIPEKSISTERERETDGIRKVRQPFLNIPRVYLLYNRAANYNENSV